ncbi:hypothetical protein AC579_10085 [Pseudocercospora musae]|uniref:Uncharacterized protein n=1 Tax=Pseudocercospora musae TaxID=113226 RepID=A0A139IGK3_9PEZI|nr:hypothetical protein AC579_10085 [Pseudocercospora musae]
MPPKKKQIDFIVTTSDPNDASNAANKKRVRSVAALKSWPERRKKIFEQLESSGSGHGAFLLHEPDQPQQPQPCPPANNTAKHASTGVAKRPRVYGPPRPESAAYRKAFARLKAKAADHHVHNSSVPCRCQQCRSKRRIANTPLGAVPSSHAIVPARSKRMADGSEKLIEFSGDMAMITPPSSPGPSPSPRRLDPFNLYPVQYQPCFDLILHHMMTVYAPRGWPALKISRDQGVKWEWFMTQNSLSEPALFYVRLLFGSGDMIRLGSLRSDIMYWLRQEAIKAINDALGDPNRSCSDALILAVGRIALHEHMYGDKYASSHVHRPAQKRMIEMRGGMKALEFPELVKRLMRWSDRIMAVGSGTPRMLEDDETNPNFTLKQSVGAIQGWAPHEMPGVRSKIRISDLVNDDEDDK